MTRDRVRRPRDLPPSLGRGLVLLALVAAGVLVVVLWGDDLRPEVHAFLQNVARRL